MSVDFKYQWLYSFDGFSSPVCIIGLCVREREREESILQSVHNRAERELRK